MSSVIVSRARERAAGKDEILRVHATLETLDVSERTVQRLWLKARPMLRAVTE